MEKHKKNFKLNFPASGKYISPARLAISSLASQSDFSVQEIQDIKKMFSDACKCAIEQAYGHGSPEKNRSLMVECSVADDKMNIAIAGKGVKISIEKEKQL